MKISAIAQPFRMAFIRALLIIGLAGVVPQPAPLLPGLGLLQPAVAVQTPSAPTPAPAWAHLKSDLSPDPAQAYGRLENGFRFVLMPNAKPKDRVSMHLVIESGSLQESQGQQGLAHFLEHMLFDGTTHFPPGELVKYFQSIGMQFGPDANAHTGFNETVYDILLPDGTRESLDKALLVIQDYAEGALLLEEEIVSERGVVLAEKRTRDSTGYRTFVKSFSFEFEGLRITQRMPIGTEAVLKTADRDRLRDYYDTWYRPERMVLVMVGDFELETARELIRERFTPLKARTPAQPDPELGLLNHEGLKTFYHYEKEAGSTRTRIEVTRSITPQTDSPALRRRMLVRSVANRVVQNRINALLTKPNPPFTSAGINAGIFLKEIEYAGISAESNPDNWEAALNTIEQILRQALIHGFTAAEIERVQKELRTELETAVAKASTRESGDLAREIMWGVKTDRVVLSPQQEQDLYGPMIEALAPEIVHNAFRAIWEPAHRLVMVTGNAEVSDAGGSPQTVIAEVYNRSRQVAVAAPAAQKQVTFPYLEPSAPPGRIASRQFHDDLGIEQIDFENGLMLNLKQTDFKADEILVNVIFGRGQKVEPLQKPGLSRLSGSVLNESGFGRLDLDELERALAGKNTSVQFGVGSQYFNFSGRTVAKEIPLLFQLLYTFINDPGFRPQAYDLVMQRFEQRYQALSTSIDGNMRLSGSRFLAGGDSRFGLPAPAHFRRLTLEDVRAFIQAPLGQAPLEVSVVGDFKRKRVIEAVARYLGSLPPRHGTAVSPRDDNPRFPETETLQVAVPTKIDKALVVVAYPTPDFWDIHRTRRLNVLAEVFSDRLREQIREKLGASYSPSVYNHASRAYPRYGLMQTFVHVDPRQADTVIAEVQKIAAELARSGVTADELQRAIDPIRTSLKDLRQTNGYWLRSVLTGSRRYPQQLQWSRNLMDDYAAMTVAEISTLARTYLDNGKAAVVVIKPENATQSG